MGLTFGLISYDAAASHVERWHYSRKMPRGRNICFGWFVDDVLYAVAVYGNGVNPYQAGYLARETGLKITKATYVEAKRFARSEPAHELQLTAFLAKCHRALRDMGYRIVVSFSDPAMGHTGGLYRAANFIAHGETQAEWHVVDENGQPHHRRVAYRHAKRYGMSIEEARVALKLRRVKTKPRQRWLLPLQRGDRAKLLAHISCACNQQEN